jgi:hypothetical protein
MLSIFFCQLWTPTISMRTYVVKSHCKDSRQKIRTKYSQKENARPQSHFLHSCHCEWLYIPTICLPILGKYAEYINPQKPECRYWDWGRAVSFLGVHNSDFLCCVRWKARATLIRTCFCYLLASASSCVMIISVSCRPQSTWWFQH